MHCFRIAQAREIACTRRVVVSSIWRPGFLSFPGCKNSFIEITRNFAVNVRVCACCCCCWAVILSSTQKPNRDGSCWSFCASADASLSGGCIGREGESCPSPCPGPPGHSHGVQRWGYGPGVSMDLPAHTHNRHNLSHGAITVRSGAVVDDSPC